MPVGAGLAIVGAATAYSAHESSQSSKRADKTANKEVGIGQQLVTQTDPLRQALIDRSQTFLSPGGGVSDVMSSAPYLAYKDAANTNFARAKDNILATTPTGGALTNKLGDLEANRASTLTQGAGQIYDAETARALSLATGQLPVALGAIGQGGNTQALLAGAQAQQSSAKAQSAGSAAGAYLGAK
jgi:hypothetical protein